MGVCVLAVGAVSLYTNLGQCVDTVMMESLFKRGFLDLQPVANFASVPLLLVLAALVAMVAVARRRYALAVRALILICGANATTQILKLILARPFFGVGYDLENSFPSGHATFAASIGFALIVVAPAGWRRIAAATAWLWMLLMGLTVVQQGWHRPADVLGAFFVCALWGLLFSPVEERERRFPWVQTAIAWIVGLAIALGVVACVAGIYLGDLTGETQLTTPELGAIAGEAAGLWLAVAAVLLIGGVSGLGCLLMDRLSASLLYQKGPRPQPQNADPPDTP